MVRAAALYDIHGNLPALEAVLNEVGEFGVEEIVVGGDVVPGPMSRECLDCLFDHDAPTKFIQGNGETEVLAQLGGHENTNLPESVRESIRWVSEQLTQDQERELRSWPLTIDLELDGLGHVLFCHATPRNNTEIFTHQTAEDRVLPAFVNVTAPLVICGHTHIQFDRTIRDVRVVNAGSVGMPFAPPGAYWLLLDRGVQLRHTSYDLEHAAAQVRATNYPGADDFAARNILQPPTEEQMLAVYAKVEMS